MIQLELVNNRLTPEQLKKLIREHNAKRYLDNVEYYEGRNPTIMAREFPQTQAPHNKLPSPYGRKIIKTVAGYMYQPGLINYTFPDESYGKLIDDIFYANREPLKTHQMGVKSSLQGVGYEVHYLDGTEPRFTPIDTASGIPVYSWDIEPKLIAFVRLIKRDEKRTNIEAYYADIVEHLVMERESQMAGDFKIAMVKSAPHYYADVPVVVYRNNDEEVGDFEPVKPIIDAMDVLMSDAMNEFDRFAFAYLVLKGMRMDANDAEKIKQMRMFQGLDDTGDVKFLTKDIPTEFISWMADKLNRAIYSMTAVPDLTDDRLLSGDMSGKAMRLMFHNFEVSAAATKEANFKEGLYRRFDLLNGILTLRNGAAPDVRDIEITMNRNERADMLEMAETMEKYAGHISERTLLQNFAPFIQDVDEELATIEKERSANMELFNASQLSDESDQDSEETSEERDDSGA